MKYEGADISIFETFQGTHEYKEAHYIRILVNDKEC